MRSSVFDIDLQVDELLKCTEADAQRLQNSLSLLDDLRKLVIKRDEAGLHRLLKAIQALPKGGADIQAQREATRRRLAEMLGWEIRETTLSRLETVVSEPRRHAIAERKAQLMSLTMSLRTEYSRTAILLSECARFNRLLLDNILQSGRITGVTYTSDGSKKQQSQTAFVDMHF